MPLTTTQRLEKLTREQGAIAARMARDHWTEQMLKAKLPVWLIAQNLASTPTISVPEHVTVRDIGWLSEFDNFSVGTEDVFTSITEESPL